MSPSLLDQIYSPIKGQAIYIIPAVAGIPSIAGTTIANSLSLALLHFHKISKWPQWDTQGPGGNRLMKKT